MHPILSNFEVIGLHEVRDLRVQIDADQLVIVGENGSGKTTLITIMFYFLTGQWERLRRFTFTEIGAVIQGTRIAVSRSHIDALYARSRHRMSRSWRHRMGLELRHLGVEPTEENIDRYYQQRKDRDRSFDGDLFEQTARIKVIEADALRKSVVEGIGRRILYLPTYRRIEHELKSIFPEMDVDEFFRKRGARLEVDPNYVELVEFGMTDVARNFTSTLTAIKEGIRARLYQLMLSYLSEIIAGRHREVDLQGIESAPNEVIVSVIAQIDDQLIGTEQKSRLLEVLRQIKERHAIDPDEQVIAHFFHKLLDLYAQQEKAQARIVQFVDLCNKYLTGKRLRYDRKDFTLVIAVDGPNQYQHLDLKDLSSGEKQIVSLFSHLLLAGNHRFYVLIDEPELSLSVDWQRTFLIDILGTKVCDGLIAVTHSPFTFDNALDRNARAINDFTRVRGG